MPIYADLRIGSVPVSSLNGSSYLVSLRVDQNLERSEADRLEIEIANTNGRFNGKFSPADKMLCTLVNKRNIKTASNELTQSTEWCPIFRDADVIDVTYDLEVVKISGNDMGGTFADSLPKEYDSGKGKRVSQIVKEVIALHEPKISNRVVDIRNDPIVEQKIYQTNRTFQDIFDELADIAGAIWYTDELGVFRFMDFREAEYYEVGNYVINANDRYSCLGYCNKVCVIGGNKLHRPDEDGSEIQDHEDNVAWAEDKEDQKRHGILVAPTYYAPHLTKPEEVQRHADNLLEWYKSKRDVAKPVLFGVCPPLRAKVMYSVGEITVTGVVRRRVIEWSARGWYTRLEVVRHDVNYAPTPTYVTYYTDGDYVIADKDYITDLMSEDFLRSAKAVMGSKVVIFNPDNGDLDLLPLGNIPPSGYYILMIWSWESTNLSDQLTFWEAFGG